MGARGIALVVGLLAACSAREPSAAEPTPATRSDADTEQAPLVTLELGLLDDEARRHLAERQPGSTLAEAEAVLAVRHRIAAPWHIYWKNPGESGLRTRVELKGRGFEAGELVYPAPDRFVAEGGQVSYGWAGDAVLFVPLSKLADIVSVELRSDWLACHESCIPGYTEVEATLANLETPADATTLAMIDRIPEPAGDRLAASWTGNVLSVRAATPDIALTQFFPYAHDHAAIESTQIADTSLELRYGFDGQFDGQFDGRPPIELGQGVVAITQAGEARWLELAVPWPTL